MTKAKFLGTYQYLRSQWMKAQVVLNNSVLYYRSRICFQEIIKAIGQIGKKNLFQCFYHFSHRKRQHGLSERK